MWIIVGYILCGLAKATRQWKLYTASRHSFRSGRPGLFLQYLRYLEGQTITDLNPTQDWMCHFGQLEQRHDWCLLILPLTNY